MAMTQSTSEQIKELLSQASGTRQEETSREQTLNSALAQEILRGLDGGMTEEEAYAFAENLLRPQLKAGLETARQKAETARLAGQQEIDNLAQALARSIEQQQSAYRRSMADVQNAALSRGMGRSSYTMQTLAGQGNALAEAVRRLTEETARQQGQAQQRITQAAEQSAATQSRLQEEYAANLAAKMQELRETQRQEANRNYLTAISSALGQKQTSASTERAEESRKETEKEETTSIKK